MRSTDERMDAVLGRVRAQEAAARRRRQRAVTLGGGALSVVVMIRPLVDGVESSQSPIDVTAENGWQCSFGKLSLHVDNEKDVVPKVRNDFANDGEKPS